MPSYKELLYQFKEAIEKSDLAFNTAKLYLYELSLKSDINLYLNFDEEADPALSNEFKEGMQRLLRNEPLAYVLGYRWFYGYRFKVNSDVLIPRDETEELVAFILTKSDEFFKDKKEIKAVDIGTGSGAIALSLAKEDKRFEMSATDISEMALAVAKENAQYLDVSVDFKVGDMLQPLIENKESYDILISNPPYIPQKEVIADSVKDYEPHVALFGGNDGLAYYEKLLSEASKILNEKALIFFEMGWNQGAAISKIAERYFPNCHYEIRKDINGKDRMFCLEINS